VGVKHQAVEIYNAAAALKKSAEKLKEAKEAYDGYKESLKEAKENYSNGIIDKEDYDDLKEDEKYYAANIGLLTASLVAKGKNMVQTIAATGSSASTYGFNFDAQMDIDALEQQSLDIMTSLKSSNINTNSNLIINAGNNALIEGSDIKAAGAMDIAANNVDIIAGRETYEHSADSKHAHITVSYALHGGLGVSAEADATTGVKKSASYVNSHLNASDIRIRSAEDTNIKGALVTAANDLTLDVGEDLTVQSLQDTYKEKEYTIGVSGGYSGGSQPKNSQKTDPKANAGVNFSITNGKSKWVGEQTQIIGSGNVNVTVGDKTELKGAQIASASDKLTLDTGSLVYSDIKDKDKSNTIGGGLSWSKEYGTKPNGQNKEGENSFNTSFEFSDKRQLNRAVIGEGDIIIRDNPNQDISGLKRDAAYAQVKTKDTGVSLELDSDTLNVILHPIQTGKDIYSDTIRSGKIIGTVTDGITKAFDATDPIQWSNVGDYIYDSFAYQHASKNFVADNPEIAAIMSDPNATPADKQLAQQIHLNYLSDQLEIERNKLLIYNSDFINQGPAAESGGMFVKKTGNIYLNTGEISEDDTFTTTLGHEVSHSIDKTNNQNYGEDYADLMGDNLNDSLNMEFDLANLPEITNTVRTSEEWREQNKNGHSGIAIDNYTQEGNIKKGDLTYYDLWPELPVGRLQLQSDVTPDYHSKLIKSTDELKNIDPSISGEAGHVSEDGEERLPDGIIMILTNYEQDKKAKELLKEKAKNQIPYNATKNNCSTNVQNALIINFPNFDAREKIKPTGGLRLLYNDTKSVTPNSLYNNLLKIKNSEIIKGPNEMNKKPYIEYFGKTNRVDE